eukprot:7451403-Alexandrium_andersonii.AAC.1
MSASLVGSEMCIRDRTRASRPRCRRRRCRRRRLPVRARVADPRQWRRSVSYTHLTLPTICSV